MSGLVLKHICKAFDGRQVLEDVSLQMTAGELLVLLGPSGCGKSTLLRIIAGLEAVDSGEVYIDGKRVEHLRPRDRNVALVFQNYSLYPHMTVERNLAFPLKVSGVPRRERSRRVHAVAEMLGLADRLDDRPGQLSGGQRQRVALGRAVVREPSTFLLDEPLSNLDTELRMRMRQEIVRLQRDLGKTMIHVTHDQAEALSMGDRIAVLNKGRIEQVDPPDRIYNDPATQFVASFIGYPQMNLVHGRLLDGYLAPFGFPAPRVVTAHPAANLVIGLRPENIHVCTDGSLTAQVAGCDYAGDSYTAQLAFESHRLTVSRIAAPLEVGRSVRFDLDESRLVFFDAVSGRNLARDGDAADK